MPDLLTNSGTSYTTIKFEHEDGCGTFLRNTPIHPQYYVLDQSRKSMWIIIVIITVKTSNLTLLSKWQALQHRLMVLITEGPGAHLHGTTGSMACDVIMSKRCCIHLGKLSMCGHGTYIDIRRDLTASHSIQHALLTFRWPCIVTNSYSKTN